MRFDLINYQDSSTTVVELDEHLRMPLTAYKSARFCLIQDLIEMSNLNWKIILDEAFRSIHSDGEVEFEIREFSRYDLRNLFIFLGAAANNRECELIRYARVKGNQHQIILKVLRVHPIDSAWSICYISDGENLKQIVDVGERFFLIQNMIHKRFALEKRNKGPAKQTQAKSPSAIGIPNQSLIAHFPVKGTLLSKRKRKKSCNWVETKETRLVKRAR